MKYQRHSDTSVHAALSVEPNANTLRAEVYSFIVRSGPHGATDEEICEALHMGGSTERPRRVELMDGGFVRDSTNRRNTRSGRYAVVWIATSVADALVREVADDTHV
jgi:hypothetical protein